MKTNKTKSIYHYLLILLVLFLPISFAQNEVFQVNSPNIPIKSFEYKKEIQINPPTYNIEFKNNIKIYSRNRGYNYITSRKPYFQKYGNYKDYEDYIHSTKKYSNPTQKDLDLYKIPKFTQKSQIEKENPTFYYSIPLRNSQDITNNYFN